MILVFVELMAYSHQGLKKICMCKLVSLIHQLVTTALLVFVGSTILWVDNLQTMAGIGLATSISFIGYGYLESYFVRK